MYSTAQVSGAQETKFRKHLVTLAAWRWSCHNSKIDNDFRFVCFQEEELRELLSRKQRPFDQVRCSPLEQHTGAVVVTGWTKR